MTSAPRVAILEKQGGILSWHDDLAAGFRTCGAEVRLVQLRPATWKEHRAKWRLEAPRLCNPELLARVARTLAEHRPDLVIVLKHAGLPATALDAWRAALAPGVPFVGWLCDHLPSLPEEQAPALDGVYYFDSATRPILEAAYAGRPARLAYLPLAVDAHRFAAPAQPFDRRRARLVFAGKNTDARRRLVAEYRALGGRVDTFGPRAAEPLRPWRRRRLDAGSLARLYASYVATLNLLQAPNTQHGLNLRAFEIPAAGGLGTYPQVPDLPSLFTPGDEIIAYRDLPDLKAQIDALLAEPARAAAIAAAGQARVLREHTYAHRARRILDDWLT